MFKKVFSLILVVTMALSLVACGGASNAELKSEKQEMSKSSNVLSNISNLKCVTEYGDDTNGSQMDTISFGTFEGKTIKWLVLKKEGNKALIFSLNAVARKSFPGYEYDESNFYWKDSYVRKWLNNDFYNSAFNEDEKALIIKNNKNNLFIDDNVFILDKKMLGDYFDIFSRDWIDEISRTIDGNSVNTNSEILGSYKFSPIVSKLASENGHDSSMFFMDGEEVKIIGAGGISSDINIIYDNGVRPAMWVTFG